MAHSAWGTMRIAALPLTRGRPPITYYSFQIQRRPPPKDAPPPKQTWLPQEGVVKWATLKVDSTWSSWGKAKSGSWRLRVFELGERFLDRLDFEESAFKCIDVKHAPPTKVPEELTGAEREQAEAAWAQIQIPLLYPPKVTSAQQAISDLQALVQQRIPVHNKGFWTYLLLAPLTAPFMIIPIIPNLPFFFCAWRAWSHYQALRGARHIDGLLKTGKIVPQALTALDAVYEIPQSTSGEDRLIVARDSLGHAMRTLDMRVDETKDILRAYEQALNRSR
ncbi:mitochondrial K+-H+ exchange-related-domain-containing protein [Mycena amicta]|nr:mitochondrial K+-H+ exchange-related-domain-containing protein [Mycena amicta]